MPPVAEKPKNRPLDVQTYLDAVARHLGQHVYASLLGLKDYDTASLHQKVKVGLSYAALDRFSRTLDLTAAELAPVLHITQRTFQRRKVARRLLPDESDRLLRLSKLIGKALELFEGDVQATKTWLDSPIAALGGARPIELAQTEPGAAEVETLIGRLEHGVFA